MHKGSISRHDLAPYMSASANATLIDENTISYKAYYLEFGKTSRPDLDFYINNWIHITRILTKMKNLIK